MHWLFTFYIVLIKVRVRKSIARGVIRLSTGQYENV